VSDFADTLRAAGLLPGTILADGKRRRCPTTDKPKRKNGQYVLVEGGLTGFWRNFAEGLDWNVWKTDQPISPAQQARAEAAAKRNREKERADRRQGIQDARALWASAKPYRHHQYIADKGLSAQGCNGLRIWTGTVRVDQDDQWIPVTCDWLLVPIYFGDKLVNVQRISTTGIKRQMRNAPQRGCWLTLDRPGAAVTVFVEGLATGLAIFQSVRTARVVVTFFADNLLPVIDYMKPTGNVCIAADNDWQTKVKRGFNPGIDKAKNAAELIDCGVAWPEGIEGTDWADFLKEIGERGPRRVEREILAKAKYVMRPS